MLKSLIVSVLFSLAQTPRSALVVVLDDVGAGDLAVAENIQAMAARGMAYSRAYSFPVCSPSRLAAMCGILPRRVGLGDICNSYSPAQTPSPYPPRTLLSIAEAAKPAGYSTGLFGKYHLGRPGGLVGNLFDVESSPFVQGWDYWRAGSPDSIAFGPGDGYYSWDRVQDGVRSLSTVYATDLQVDELMAWWAATPGPRLAWLGLSAAHQPYDTPPGYPAPGSTREAYEQIVDHADQRLGEVFAQVDLSETFVLIMGDNGTPDAARPPGSAAGIWKGTTREGGVRVPFILAGPGIKPGCSSRLVSLLDVPATLAELLGFPGNFQDSVSVFGPERPWLFTERYSLSSSSIPDDRAVIESSGWKLRLIDPDGVLGPGSPVEETYFVADGVENPLVPPAAVLKRLRSELASLPERAQ